MRVLLNAFDRCSLPLFVSLCFWESRNWRSYSLHGDTVVPGSVEEAIEDLFEVMEEKHGKVLVAHSLG